VITKRVSAFSKTGPRVFENSVGDCQLTDELVTHFDLLLELGNLPIARASAFSSVTCKDYLAGYENLVTLAAKRSLRHTLTACDDHSRFFTTQQTENRLPAIFHRLLSALSHRVWRFKGVRPWLRIGCDLIAIPRGILSHQIFQELGVIHTNSWPPRSPLTKTNSKIPLEPRAKRHPTW
jgi:hypothetical protein